MPGVEELTREHNSPKREQAAQRINLAGIYTRGGGWVVPSETWPDVTYLVHLNDEDRPNANRGDFHDEGPPPWSRDPSCTCLDHLTSAKPGELHRNRCKHIAAVFAFLAPQEALNGTYLDNTPGKPYTGPELTFWCCRCRRDEPITNAPWESQLHGVLSIDRCELFDDAEQLPTPNEPDEKLEPIYSALRRMGQELAELRKECRNNASQTQDRRRDIRVDLGGGEDSDPGGPAQ